jgi:predicted AlkP superfamily phosphohydrolase/phosphomutase
LVGEFLFEQGDEDPHPEERDRVFERICEIDEQRFTLVKHLLGKKQCDCVIAAFSGLHKLARLYNGGYDRNREQDPQRMSMLREYYRWLDRQIGEVRSALDPATVLLVVSVHNVERLDGEIHINEWLIQNGYLSVSQYPDEPTAIADVNVEWAKTKAWASGDSGQVYVNLKGREADGIVDSAEYETLLDELISRLKEIPDENGNPLNTRLFKRHEIYSGPFSQYAPDLFIAFDGCRRKCGEKVGFGSGSLYSSETAPISARGSDGLEGFFCIAGPGIPPKGEYVGASLLDVAPTVLDVMDLEIPGELEGVSVSGKKRTPEEEEALVQERLKFLGY